MQNKEKNINRVDLVFDCNDNPTLANRDQLIKSLNSDSKKTNDYNHVNIKELNENEFANQWLRSIDTLAILENQNDDLVIEFVKKLERKSEQLYHDLNKVIISKYQIKDENLINKIKELNAKNDPKIGEYLDEVDDVIYNVEADWNDNLNYKSKIDLYDTNIITWAEHDAKESSNALGKEEVNINDNVVASNDAADFESNKYILNLDTKTIIANNKEKVDPKQLSESLKEKGADELYDFIELTSAEIHHIKDQISNQVNLYQCLSTKTVTKNTNKLNEIFNKLKGNSDVIDKMIQTVDNSDDFNVREIFNNDFEAIDSNAELLKKLLKVVNSDEHLLALNTEITELNVVLDTLTTKLAIAYIVAFENGSKFSKRLIRRNRELEKKAQTVIQNDGELGVQSAEDIESCINNGEYSEELKALLKKYQDKSGIMYDQQFNLFASKNKTNAFRKNLDKKLRELMKLESTKFTTLDAKEYVMNEYFLFLNSELGIVGDLTELVGLVELQRIKLMSEIAEDSIYNFGDTEIKSQIEISLKFNFETVKLLAAEILILKAILLHRDVINVIKAQAKKHCSDMMTIIAWDRRLNWWIDTTREVIAEAYFNPIYGKDQGVQYLFHELNEMYEDDLSDVDDSDLEEVVCEECGSDYSNAHSHGHSEHRGYSESTSSEDTSNKPMVMRFETDHETVRRVPLVMRFLSEKVVEKRIPLVMRFESEKVVEKRSPFVMKFETTKEVIKEVPVKVVDYFAVNDHHENEQTNTNLEALVYEIRQLRKDMVEASERTHATSTLVEELRQIKEKMPEFDFVAEPAETQNASNEQVAILMEQLDVLRQEMFTLKTQLATQQVADEVAKEVSVVKFETIEKTPSEMALAMGNDNIRTIKYVEYIPVDHEVTKEVEVTKEIVKEVYVPVEKPVEEKVVEEPVKEPEVEKQEATIQQIFVDESPLVDDEEIPENETEEERLRRLAKKGMTAAGLRIAALIKETQKEIDRAEKDFEKEQEAKERQKIEQEARMKAERELVKRQLAEQRAQRLAALKAEREKKLALEKEKAAAKRQKELEQKRLAKQKEIEKAKALKQKEIEKAKALKEKELEKARILKEKEKARQLALRQKEIEKAKAIKEREAEKARMRKEKARELALKQKEEARIRKEQEALKRKEDLEKAKQAAKNRQMSKENK